MDDKVEIYWRLYLENCTQGRHHETMRATLTTIIVAISAASLGLLKAESHACTQVILPILVFALGIFGAIVTRKHYERFTMHMRRARALREKIDEILNLGLAPMQEAAGKKQARDFPHIYKLRLSWLWTSVHVAVSLTGLATGAAIARTIQCT